MNTKSYDLIFGIGAVCSCSETLRKAGLQHLSFPGDWTSPLGDDLPAPNLVLRVDWLCNGFDGFFNPEDFVFKRRYEGTQKDIYNNVRTHYVFNHDFPAGSDFSTELPKVVAKYVKRRNRLFSLIRNSRRVLVFRLDLPNGKMPTSLDDCRYARRRLQAAFPGVDFDFALMQPDPNRTLQTRLVEHPEPWLTRIAFEYNDPKSENDALYPDLQLTSAAIAEIASVRDYRTTEEKRQHALNRRRRRYARVGAKNGFDYQRIRLANWLKGICAALRTRAGGGKR